MVANLRGVAEAAKIKLSTEEKVVIRMPLGGGIEAVLTRQVGAGGRARCKEGGGGARVPFIRPPSLPSQPTIPAPACRCSKA